MKDITIIKATTDSPFVEFNPNSGELKIQGKSLLENTFNFYSPIMEMINDHYNSSDKPITANIMMDYLNSSTSRYLMELFMIIEKSKLNNQVNWYFEDGDDIIEEKGRQYQSILNLAFNIEMMNVIHT